MIPGDRSELELEDNTTVVIYWDRILVALGKALAILIVAILIYALGYLSAQQRRIYIPPEQLYPTGHDIGRSV